MQHDPYSVDIIQARDDVRQFMTEISTRTGRWMPGMPGDFSLVRASRIRMIYEEWNETQTAIDGKDSAGELDGMIDLLYVILGLAIELDVEIFEDSSGRFGDFCINDILAHAIAGCSNDFLVDSEVNEALAAFGWCEEFSRLPVGAAWDEVHAANMRKFDGGYYDAATGKWRKPADWVGPDIAGVLAKYPRRNP